MHGYYVLVVLCAACPATASAARRRLHRSPSGKPSGAPATERVFVQIVILSGSGGFSSGSCYVLGSAAPGFVSCILIMYRIVRAPINVSTFCTNVHSSLYRFSTIAPAVTVSVL